MEWLKQCALVGLIFGSLLLSLTAADAFAYGHPLRVVGLVLAFVGCFLLAASRWLDRKLNSTESYSQLPLDDISSNSTTLSPGSPASPRASHARPPQLNLRRMRLVFVLGVVLVCIRAETVRRIVRDIQCVGPSYTGLFPLLFALVDFAFYQRHKSTPPDDVSNLSRYQRIKEYWATTRLRYVVTAAIVSLSSVAILHQSSSPSSVYICLPSNHTVVMTLQNLAFVLDFGIVFCADYLVHVYFTSAKSSPAKSISIVAWVALISSAAIFVWGVVWFLAVPEDRFWMLVIPKGFVWSLFKLTFLCCVTALSACVSTFYSSAISTTAVATSVFTVSVAIQWTANTTQPFPPTEDTPTFLLYCALLVGLLTLLHTQSISEDSRRGGRSLFSDTPLWLPGVVLVLFCIRGGIWLNHTTEVAYHPIDLLIHKANTMHNAYLKRASSSPHLQDAVTEYQRRHGRRPPPMFHEWHRYAIGRTSVVIDEFDKINDDLLPFWTMSPSEIRETTWKLISNPWNDVAGLSIRNGKATISPNVVPTHRWMLDGIIAMIEPFSEFLPDMDLGFNLNDECRVAVPYEDIEPRRKSAKRSWNPERKPIKTINFSENRGATWKPIPEEPMQEASFTEMSWQKTFHEFGNAACPPGSAARNTHHWDTGHMCTSCVAPHSLGAYLSNWTVSADICHQPDMANLHGFYLSPAAFKASHNLLPVFSQSKAHGYNDILYPSPWNYLDKVKYDPNDEHGDPAWEEKTKTLFWRGSTSEGVSAYSGVWKGMNRQRFVHLSNNINKTLPPQPALLPYPISPHRKHLTYTSLPISLLSHHLPTDIHFVDQIIRCGGPDCSDQANSFAPLYPPSDFQAHWSYRYLLDLDGAGFSGRFLSFVQSKSLPFKAALFREWWDDRLTPWLHFVPLDLRGHGFWATLMYFMGFEGEVEGKMVMLPGKDKQARFIAEEGREWASKVLRKEDMEIYMFRLLLEWGRLTDDARDELGFSG